MVIVVGAVASSSISAYSCWFFVALFVLGTVIMGKTGFFLTVVVAGSLSYSILEIAMCLFVAKYVSLCLRSTDMGNGMCETVWKHHKIKF